MTRTNYLPLKILNILTIGLAGAFIACFIIGPIYEVLASDPKPITAKAAAQLADSHNKLDEIDTRILEAAKSGKYELHTNLDCDRLNAYQSRGFHLDGSCIVDFFIDPCQCSIRWGSE